MIVKLNDILPAARKKGYAVGHFNTSNLEITQAIIKAAEELTSPVIVGVSEKAIIYAGLVTIAKTIRSLGQSSKIPVVLHLDHGRDFDIVRKCIDVGFTSVMIDGSYLPFKENLKLTKRVVKYAHKRNVSVEAEIGRLAGIEDGVESASGIYTDPEEAERFADEAHCDALAVAIGTSHGAYKFKGKPRLRIDILKEIAKRVKIPLVLHGASGVKSKWVNYANKYGAKIENVSGVPDHLIKEAIKNGISKINVDTDLRIAFTAGIREFLSKNPEEFDPRKILNHGRQMVIKTVRERILLFGSAGKGSY
ncbi:MAG: class II fructose-1,6-bisphosphate aldolase [candidate division WOR-3 bacterium]|nr:class II fructose-1,6-bisphosphate aldolase [candidate division WOR-3 bacterium]